MDIQSIVLASTFNVPLFALMIGLILFSAFFSMSETAFSSCSESRLKLMIDNKVSGSKKAMYLYEKFDKTLVTLLIGNNLVNIALSTFAVIFFTQLISNLDESMISLITTGVITIVLLIFGEIVPKMLAKRNPESIAVKVAFIVYVIMYILYPFVLLFYGIQKIFASKKDDEPQDREELDVIVDEFQEQGAIEDEEAEQIHNLLDLNETTVEDIMVPRIKMASIPFTATLDEVKAFMLDNPYSRIPVYKNDKDHIVGILYERDFFPAIVKNKNCAWKKLLRPVKYVSGAMHVDDLIKDLQKSKTHLAVVISEIGEVQGIVTMEDALEEIVGEIYDEHDNPSLGELRFDKNDDGSYIVDADMFVDDLFEKLDIGQAPENIPSKISGWLFEKCESIPVAGFKMQYLSSYAKEDPETEGKYIDYNKMLIISIYEVKNRAITLAKVEVRDATSEEIDNFQNDEE